ncbi:MAG: hypothetical protein JOZ72_06810 [Alphaproteobacteria bacterium]|nr:hypothetical protein [Alphaproteobacteria bacterium]
MLRSALAACAALVFAATAAQAATLQTIKSFCATGGTACTDGSDPSALVRDAAGTFYGTTRGGGAYREGSIFSLVPNADHSAWTYKVLRSFCPKVGVCTGGAAPTGNLVIDTAGNLYGVTTFGGHDAQGASPGFGTVFKLTPDRKLVVLYRFCVERKCVDGSHPEAGLTYAGAASGVPYDGVSPLYGTAGGGAHNKGLVYELSFSGGVATRKTIYDFCAAAACTDGLDPLSSLTVDAHGSLIGTTGFGGAHEAGVIFKLTPGSGGTWTESVLHDFDNPPGSPMSGVLIDGAGNMFGTAGSSYAGVLYRLSGSSYSVLHTFCQQDKCADGGAPRGDLSMDASGDLTGVTSVGGVNNSKRKGGTVFSYSGSGGFSLLYSFCSEARCKDGNSPNAGVVLDADGSIFGTTGDAGENGSGGTIFKLTP